MTPSCLHCMKPFISTAISSQLSHTYVAVSLIHSVLLFLKTNTSISLSVLTLLVGRQEEHQPLKIEWWGVGVVISLEQGADCLLMVQHQKPPLSLASFNSRLVLPSWYRLTQVVLEKRQLNGCSSNCSRLVLAKIHHWFWLVLFVPYSAWQGDMKDNQLIKYLFPQSTEFLFQNN